MSARRLEGLLRQRTQILSHERRAVMLAFTCNFLLLASYYILRPVRDTVATVFGADQLQLLFTGTFIGTLIAAPIYAWLSARVRLNRLLPGVFWFWLANVLLFQVLFEIAPENRWIGGAYYVWFSVINLFMISVFWTLMSDLFSASQATRLFGLIAAGGSVGAIAGPLVVRLAVNALGLDGMLVVAAGGFAAVIVLVHLLMREKQRLPRVGEGGQPTTLDHDLAGGALDGFRELLRSAYSRHQAAFILLMTWVNTVAYFLQTDVISQAFSGVAARAVAIADISLVVNVLAAIILLFGLGRYVHRFGVTAGLILNPIIMVIAFVALALSPTLLMIQALQVIRQVSQYAIARPSREICFTVVPQADRYKTKNVIDVVVYRFGDLSSAWMQAGLRAAGLRVGGSAVAGFGISIIWGVGAVLLGRRFEVLRAQQAVAHQAAPPAQV
ncbi:MAG TPA: MFS transporter [Steroidobacteraceae bacterium]